MIAIDLALSFNPRAHVGRDSPFIKRSSANSFQSTRPRGARPLRCWLTCSDLTFQSTRPRGARQAPLKRALHASEVSIHAPTWGATPFGFATSTTEEFQSTRPRGARPFTADMFLIGSSFNPRAHVGRDEFYRNYGFLMRVSIHAPTWGATQSFGCSCFAKWFQSTRPRGARHLRLGIADDYRTFQSTRPRGARHLRLGIADDYRTFQSTRPRGARLEVE